MNINPLVMVGSDLITKVKNIIVIYFGSQVR
jgi:hypothetical protein